MPSPVASRGRHGDRTPGALFPKQTIVLVLVVNVTAAASAFGFGYLQDAIGHIKAMMFVLIGIDVERGRRSALAAPTP